jgi:hypothetical protein
LPRKGGFFFPPAFTYTEVLDVVEDVVIESEVTAGDDINTGILLDLPVSKTQTLGLSEEVSLGDLAAPVCSGKKKTSISYGLS